MIEKAYLLEVLEGGKKAKVQTMENEIINDVLILHPYGESNFMQSDDNSLILLIYPLGSKTNAFGIPYNVLLQPTLEETEKTVGNFKIGNKVKFDKDGNIEITGTNDFLATTLSNANITASTKITINAPDVSLGDAISLILNEDADLSVTIPSGSSAGTYTIDINDAGQSKVKA